MEYSTDNGTDWRNIVSSTISDGSIQPDVLNDPSTNCRVRISDIANYP